MANRLPELNHIEVMDDRVAEIMRHKTPGERLAILDDLWCFARSIVLGNLRQEHPEWSERELQQETARRMSHGAI